MDFSRVPGGLQNQKVEQINAYAEAKSGAVVNMYPDVVPDCTGQRGLSPSDRATLQSKCAIWIAFATFLCGKVSERGAQAQRRAIWPENSVFGRRKKLV